MPALGAKNIERVLAGAYDEDDFKCCLPQWKKIGENNIH